MATQKMNTKTLLVALLCTFVLSVYADIPVHCEFAKVVGKWNLQLTEDGHDKSIVQTCQMKSPLPPVASQYTITLSEPNIVTDEKGNNGTWTMIYDEGFEIVINDKKFFAFFNYTTHWGKVTSHCDETFLGTYHEVGVAPKNWGCWKGKKAQSDNDADMTPRTVVPDSTVFEISKQTFHNNETFINRINKAQTMWKAGAYPQFEGLSYAELLRKAGTVLPKHKKQARTNTLQYLKKFQAKPTVRVEDLPEQWDWRKVNGVNYVSPVRDQAQCGSCYAFGTLHMYEARVRVMSNNTQQPVFSPQNIVSCSLYSQGCDGGLEFLVSKYGEDFGFVNEKCEPYYGSSSKCNNKCAADDVTRATDYKFVGGFYGACSEAAMMEDLVKNGPVVVGFEVYDDFFNYRGGIYHHVLFDDHPNRFETVNHAVLVVGYGVAGGTKFWIVKNSWSSAWGEQGYFRIRRGTDECSIESEASVGMPVLN